MIALEDLHSDATTRIQAATYFAGETVLEDLGQSEHDREEALRERGFCVTIPPLLSASVVSQSHSRVVVKAVLAVLVEINPETNPDGANKDIYEAVAAVVSTLLAQVPTNPADNYQVAPEALDYSDIDSGLIGYLILFNKNCVI